ncbi:LOW QUALITY PROTEIN: uncharacterized protein [Procambarus clarkii]|uniref:LOW QUALITY PROTEIN: uncharacterized protein n=1 Tax=Procambarus clarkii TaxID=6728 RepID=UPI003742CD0C
MAAWNEAAARASQIQTILVEATYEVKKATTEFIAAWRNAVVRVPTIQTNLYQITGTTPYSAVPTTVDGVPHITPEVAHATAEFTRLLYLTMQHSPSALLQPVQPTPEVQRATAAFMAAWNEAAARATSIQTILVRSAPSGTYTIEIPKHVEAIEEVKGATAEFLAAWNKAARRATVVQQAAYSLPQPVHQTENLKNTTAEFMASWEAAARQASAIRYAVTSTASSGDLQQVEATYEVKKATTEFIAAWRNAVVRVPTIQTNLYQITGTTPYSAVPTTVDGVPQFTPEVAHATAEFTRVWNAAAAAPSDVNIIMGASSQRPSLKASHHAGTYSQPSITYAPASVSYDAASPSVLPHPVQPTPEVQRATAAFMAAWNEATARASQIQTILVRSAPSGTYTIEFPKQVEAAEEVKGATAHFMAAWNKAARRATVVQQAVYSLPQPVHQTENLKKTIAEFMASWEAAAQQASAIRHAVAATASSGDPQQVEATNEVKKATTEFIAAWRNAVVRVPTIQTNLYQITGTTPYSAVPTTVDGVPQFTPEVAHATAEFTRVWNAAAAAPSDVNIIMGASSQRPSLKASHHAGTYSQPSYHHAPASVSYDAASPSALPHPVQPTPEVQRATAAFMVAWNEATARASQIETILVRSAPSGTYTIEFPKQVEAAEEVKGATAHFMAAWNKAARRATVVQQAVYSLPQPLHQTENLKKTIAEFMASWEAAAQQASAIRHAVAATASSGDPQQVEATNEVKKATTEFIAAWRNAVVRVPTIQTNLYQITGTTPYSAVSTSVDGVPQFTPEVAHATAEFMKVWNAAVAAAAAAPDKNIIMGDSSWHPSLKAAHQAITYIQPSYHNAPASVSYDAASPSALLQPVQPTPEVQRATAAFMAAWNEAAARATQIQTFLVRSAPSGTYTIEIPKHVEAIEEVKGATAEFLAAWNKAARRATVVQQAAYSLPQPVHQTENLKNTTAEFMASWEAAARHASAIRHAITSTASSGDLQQVEATYEVKKATTEFIAAWRNAVVRVPTIQTNLYQITGTTPYSAVPTTVDGVPQFTPEVAHATAEFTRVWNAAAAVPSDVNIIMGASSQRPSLKASHHAGTYSQPSYHHAPASVSYDAASPSVLPHPVQPTPEVQRATAAFMAAWNEATARASQIQTILVRSAPSGTYTIEFPKQVEAAEEVKGATAHFMAAWNKAARRATVVQQAVYSLPQPVHQTENLKKTIAEFMASWEAAAQQASAIRHAVAATASSGDPQQVEATNEVKKATTEFIAAWRNAVVRVPTIQTNLYQITGTTPYSAVPTTVDGVPQFTPEVAHATAEFTRVWNAAAAAPSDVNIIMGASSQRPSLKASHHAGTYSQPSYHHAPASVSYDAASPSALPHPVQPTPEVQRATAAFMVAWNEATARASQIETILVRSAPSGTYTIEFPKQVEAAEEVKGATAHFMAAWNKAARRATVVQQAVYSLPQPVHQTENLKKTIAEFMASWEAAAQQASAIRHAVAATASSGDPQQVEATNEVKKATTEFIAAWRNAVVRVPTIQTNLYQITGTTPYSAVSTSVDGVPQFTPEVAHATAEFMKVWNAAVAAAAAAPDKNIIMGDSSWRPSLKAAHQAITYTQPSYHYAPASVSYDAASPSALLQPVQPTPEVQRATAAFMAAWNEAAARATQIQTILVRSAPSGTYTIEIPKHVEAIEEVKGATAEFLAAWNKAARRATVVQQAAYSLPQPVHQTENLKNTTAEFMASWEAAARHASAIRHAITSTASSGDLQQVEATYEVKKATTEFIAAWRNAVVRVPTIQTNLYQITGTTPYSAVPTTVDGVPQFTPEVAHATAEFTRVWNAAAAAPSDVNIIMGASSQRPSLKASHHAGTYSQPSYHYAPASVSYDAASPSALLQPVQPTPEVQRATAAFMAAWNEAAARATQIQTILVRSAPSGTYTIEIPKHVEAIEEVKGATAEFLAAWNKAARRATVVQQAAYSLPQPVHQTENLKNTTAEFMASWEAAARQASAIRYAVTSTASSGDLQQVEATYEVKKATTEFIAAWRNAVVRVPTIQTNLYQITGTTPYSAVPTTVDGVPQFTPEVAHATAEFTRVWNAAAAAPSDVNIIMGASSQRPSLKASHHAGTYSQPSYHYAPASLSYDAASPSALLQPVQPTPEVQRATAAFMAAWNEAAVRATQIQTILVRSAPSGTYTIEIPKHVEAIEEVKGATTEFLAAWNKAARRATVVKQAAYSLPQPVHQTENLKNTTAEFMASWEAAARQASAIRHVVTTTASSGDRQQVKATYEVKKATTEFIAAWRNAVVRVPTIQTNLYQITGTTPYSAVPTTVDGVPQFTPEVAHATAEFTRVWNAAAAAPSDVNIIMGASSQRPSLKASHHAGTYSQPSYHHAPASVSYDAASPSALPHPVQPTPEVQRATAAFMVAWNEATARASQIQTILVRSAPSGTYTIEFPKQVEAAEEVKGATAHFMAAWNKAARRATVVQQAVYSLPQPVHQTENLKKTIAEFMASWEAAAQQASAIRHAVAATASSGDPQQVEATNEVKKATTEFIAAWRNAVVRVPTIQTNLYQITGTTPYFAVSTSVDGVPQFTPEVAHATAEFMKVWNAAVAAAAAAPDKNIIMGDSSWRPSLKAAHQAITYTQPSYHYAPASVSYDAASPSALLQPVQPTPEVQRATAAFMAAWNEAAARATQIQTILVRSAPSGTYTIEIPKHVEAIEEVKGATAEFLAAWNKAARRATVVQQAAYSLPQPVHQTENLKNTTAEFMASWEAAARHASAIRHAITSTASSGDLQQVEATYEVKKATTEFIAAWRNAVVRVPTIQTNLYQITGTTPYSAVPTTVDGVPQFTPEVAHATAEFTRVWNAAAAAPSDVNIIMGASSQRPSLKASHHAGTYSQPSYHYAPASVSYDAASPSALLQPVQPTPEVQRATAAFMAAWNEAAARATQIQTILVRSAPSGTYTIEIPKHVEAIEEVKGATAEFLAAWNKAARRATVVQQAAYSLPQPVHQTENLKNTTAEFMASWEAAARQASAIRYAVTSTASSGDLQQVEATYEVKKATTEFIAAWRNAVVRVPTIQTNLYQITGTTPYSAVPTTVDGVPQFTPEVAHATAEFTRVWNAAAAAPSDVNIIMGASSQRPSLKASHHAGTYSQPSYHYAPASLSYDAASPSALLQPVQPTPEVQRATAAFMAAWNEAAVRATQIQTILVRSAPSGTYTIEIPKHVEAIEEVKGATTEFLAAWNKAARRATVVKQAAYSLPQPVHQTENLKNTTAEFMASWEAAARQASAIRHVVTTTASSGDRQQVKATYEVKKATTEFIAAWRNAVVRVPTIQTNLYQITGTTPYSAVPTTVDGVPQFTPEVAHATAEFTRVWNAAAAAPSDVNIIMGASSQRPSLKASHHAGTFSQPSYHYAPASVSYDAASPSALLQPVQPTPEVQRATAAFMAAWNEAAARATQIQTILVRSAPSGTYTIEIPKHVEAIEEVKGATAEFLAAWNKAARRATVVQQAAYSLPQPVHQTENLKNTTAEFMASWEAAARQASAIRYAVTSTASSGDLQQVEATYEVKKATTEFIAAWRNAVVRVPTIQTNLYQITGTTPYSAVPTTVDGVPQFTPEVAHATAEFTRVWNAAAAAPSDVNIIMGASSQRPSLKASHHAGTYSQPSYHYAPASLSYDAASPSALLQPVQPTPEVQRATAAFMAAWNEAAVRATQIQTILVRSAPSGTYTIEIPKHVEAIEEVKGATTEFLAAWNKAARRATVVKQAAYSLPQPVHQTENLKNTTAEFMASWEAAARQASAIRHVVTTTASSGDRQQVKATYEVKKATTEFIAAWRNAVVRVPTIQTNLYQITGTTPYSAVPTTVDGVPQFTPEVAHATAEFTRVWNAAAAAPSDVNIIMGASSQRPSLKASHHAGTYSQPSYHHAPASVSYDAASPSALPHPVQPTPEVQRATAAFMVAWNEATARASQIQTILVRSAPSGTYTIEFPKQVEAAEEVKGATAHFMAAWNKAARRATVVQQAVYSVPQPVHQTENLKKTIAEFMASWEAAAQQASAIRHAVAATASSGDPQQVEATNEVKKATTEFIAAWINAVLRVPTIQTNLYQITGTTPYSAVSTSVDGVPQFTPEVAHATAEFMKVWNAAVAAAAAAPDKNIIMGDSSWRPSLKAAHQAITYSQPSYHYAPASVSYDAASPSALLQPVQPMPEVQRATAAFMAAWNEAAARATQIQTILVRSAPSGTYTIEFPKQVEAAEEVKGATAHFMAAWNKAARRATVVQQAAYSLPQPVHQTENLKNTTAEFMASWEAAARHASAIRHAVTSTASSGDPQQVEATYEVKKATTEFIAAWRNAIVRVPTIQTNLYQITGTTPYSAVPTTVDGVPQFTPEVAHATAEFTRVWNAAAAAPSDVNIIMGASSQRPSLKASHHAGTYSQPSYHYAPASVSYDAASPSALLQPVQPTPEVQKATAAFMAAWNEAAVRATQIQTILVRSAPSGTYAIEIPKHVEAIEEVKGATTEFLAAWNKAARRATVVQQAAYSLPQPVHQTENLKNTTAEFMASWEAAARQASAIKHAVTSTASSGDRQQVKATYEVKKATTEFIAAWRNAVVRVPTIQTNLYQITGTTPYSAVPTTVDGVPQFNPDVAHATAEFTRVWNAAAAAPSDVNIIMGASSQRPSLKASHHAGTYSQPSYHHAPASVSYDAASPSALPHPVQPTPEVQRATAAFMAAWNEATARASQIQTILVRSAPSGTYTIEFPKQVEAAEEVKGATAHFMAAWNKAARRATVVQQAVYSVPQPVHQTENLKKTIAEFMASWEAAAQQASAIRHAVAVTASSGDPQQVEATYEVKKATTEFIAAWRNAVVRVPTIQTNLYQITGTTPYSAVPTTVDGVPQFTPEVAHATEEFTRVWNAAAAAAAAPSDVNIIMGASSQRPSLKASHHAGTYSQPSYHHAPASVSYDAASPSALPHPVQPTPEVQRATASFMAAWNEATARASQIQTFLVRSAPSGTYTIEFPKQVEAAEEVKGATAHFMAAWNKAARRATVVQQAVYSLPQPVHQTENLKKTIAEFMASWEAAAQQASAIRHAVAATASSGDPQQVEATNEVKKATTEFIAAWRNAVVRVPTIQTNLYQITGTTPYSAVSTSVDGVPQFTPEVAHATAEFMKVWNAAVAAAAATPDKNIIIGDSSWRPSLKAAHQAITYSQPSYHYAPASVSYDAASPSALLQPVQPTPKVQRATAAFMAAWNEAAARATQIQTILVRSAPSGTYTIKIPKHVEAIEEVKVATAEFLAAWNKAARRATVVQQAAYSLPQPVHQTENLKNTTAEFMASWEAAARHASAIRHAVTSTASSGDPQQVEATYEVKKATTEFIAAWRNAVVRVPTIQTNLYQITGTTPYSAVPITVDGVPQFTPEVAHATAEFTRVWNAAAAAPSDVNIIMGASSQRPSLKASHHAGTYSQPSYHYAPASVSYDAASPSALFQPVQPTPEVQRATAAFMAAWNEAAVRATQIQTILVRSAPSGTYAIEIPKHVEAIEEVKGATTEFLAAWNKAARRATVVQQAAYSLPQPVHQTENLKNTTAEFMASWEAAARQASAIKHAVTSTASSGDRQQVKATYEVKKATTEFIAAWRNAVVRVPTIQTNLYQITGTTPYSAVPTTVDGVPQFTPEVAHATAEFTRVWNAAAAAPSDVNIIMGASSQRPSLKASHHAGTYSKPSYHHAPASVSYDATSPSALPHPVQPTPEVQRATAAFMVAWNEATARASQIQTILVRSAPFGTYTIEFPKQVEAAEEVKGATAHFMAAWNKAARRATVVQQAVYSVPQPVHQTENLKKTIAEFMASWEAAAQQASAIRHAVAATASSGDPQQVEATNEVKKATTEFIAAWRNAVVRVPTIQTNLYQITGTTPYSAVSTSVDGVPQFTPEVAHATAEFMKVWNAAVAAAAAAPDKNIIMGDSSWRPSLKAAHQAITYSQPSYHYAPASLSYDAASPSALLQPVQPTPEVQRATAAFMAAWNEAAARATQIQTILVRSAPSGTYTIEIPKHVEAIEEVKVATAEFLAAWNKAARRATVVQQAAYSLPQPVHQTENLKNTTAEFMASWEAAARHASVIRHAVTSTASSGDPQQVEATYEVKKATTEFIAAWRNAVVRVPTIQTNLYQITGTTPYSAVPTTVDGVPQFTPEVAHATAEFTRVWNAAAAAPSDVNIIMGASSQRPSLKASHHAGTYSQPSYHYAPASLSYDAASPSALLQPVQPTPEVQRATAAFMAAWNEAAVRATQIQTILVRSAPSGTYAIEIPKHVEAIEEVKGATTEFLAAWNKAARRATVVQQAAYSLPQPVHQTENLKNTTAEFMASWEAAARQASAIKHAVTSTASSGDRQQVKATYEVKKATTEFIAAWRNAVVRVPTIQTNLYQITGTTPYSAVPTTVDGVPQFTPEVAHATAEFTRVWNAAAAAPSDVNIIMGASSQRPSLKASHHAGTYSQPSYHHAPASVSYDATSPSALPHPVQPTPEVQRATAAFMVAWNEATARASQIQTILVRSAPSGTYTIEFPKQVEAAEEVKGATAHFMAAWNKAARRATVVQQAVYSVPQPVHQTENLKKTISEFMASWEAAAQQASAIRHAVAATASSGDPQQVEATNEVKKATTEFIAAWRNAVVRVPTIQTNLYQITGTTPYSAVSTSVDGVPQFTPEVAHATAEFMKVWNAAVAAAAAAPDKNIIMGDSSWRPSLKAAHQAITYSQPSYHYAPASLSYDAASPSALLQPVQPTPEVQRATAVFMAAWNEAAARATQIQTILVRSAPSSTYTIEIPKHVEAIEEVKVATAEFLAAWNKAARRATVVQQAAYSLPQPVHQTENLKNTTAEFMASWEAAAQQASAIRHAVSATASSGDPQQVEATYEVKKATTEFIAAWRNAVVRVPTIQTNLYQITGTIPYSAVPTTVDGVPQFTPEVAHATAEFTRVWNAAAAAPSDVNIIMGASSQRPSLKASHHAGTYSQPSYHHAPASVSYDAASPSALPHPVQPTPEVQRATAAFMAAWNEATARASQIQTILVRSAPSGTYTIEFPKHVEAIDEVKGATAQFMAAWNKAARRATVVKHAVYSLPQPLQQTEDLKKTTAQFLVFWEAAAQRASAIRHAVAATASSGVPQQVEATYEFKRATEEFMAAWRKAAARMRIIQTNLYQITGTTPYSAVSTSVDGVPLFTPEVAHATAEFMKVWNAVGASDVNIIIKGDSSLLSSLKATHHAVPYSHSSYHHAPASVSYDATSPPSLSRLPQKCRELLLLSWQHGMKQLQEQPKSKQLW